MSPKLSQNQISELKGTKKMKVIQLSQNQMSEFKETKKMKIIALYE